MRKTVPAFIFNFKNRDGGFGHLGVQKTVSTFLLFYFGFFFVCLFHFSIFKDQVAGECVTGKQNRIHRALQPHSSGSEPSQSRQRRQKKREHAEHSGEKRQVSRDLFGISHCASSCETHFYLEWFAQKVHTKSEEHTEKGRNAKY